MNAIYSPKFEFKFSLFFSLHDGSIIGFQEPMFSYHLYKLMMYKTDPYQFHKSIVFFLDN